MNLEMKIQSATRQEVNMTSFHGQTIRFTYNDLVSVFGEPDSGDGYKTNCNWSLKINNVPFTIYDWKEPFNPQDFPDAYLEWHISSREPLSLENLIAIRRYIDSKI